MGAVGSDHSSESRMEDDGAGVKGAETEAAFALETGEAFGAGDFQDVHGEQLKHQEEEKEAW